jgi:CheY-like chemotaxis protein
MRVLVVDDNVDSAYLLRELIKVCGHESETATCSTQAIDLAIQWRPECVFLDLSMPDEDGYKLAGRLRTEAELRAARIVAVSGYQDDEDRRRAAQIDAHLQKPVTVDQLRQQLSRDGK